MSINPLWTPEADDKLIQLVKEKRGLYDINSPFYSNNEYKRNAWLDIEDTLRISGAKNRWEQLRAQYRSYLNIVTGKCGIPYTKGNFTNSKDFKWQFSKQFKNMTDEMCTGNLMDNEYPMDDSNFWGDPELFLFNIPRNIATTSKAKKTTVTLPKKNQSTSKESKSEQKETAIMFNKNASEMQCNSKKKAEDQDDYPIDRFFSLMATTVKKFSVQDQFDIKQKIFALVSQYEENYL